MGRKERNKINDSDTEKEKKIEEQEENEYMEEEQVVFQFEKNQNYIDIIHDTRINILDYCDNECIPLCDYLTIDVFEKFIEYLNNPF